MANSALFGRSQPVESVRTAVMNLGMWRVRDCFFQLLSQVIPAHRWIVAPTVFWRHSLGVALVSPQIRGDLEYPDTEKAYLAGLLHDIGILVNSMVAPDEFRATFQKATREQIPLDEAEQSTLGFTHSDSGRVLAKLGRSTPDLVQAVELHHEIGDPERGGPLVAIVHLSDLLCRYGDMGYGYYEPRQIDLQMSRVACTRHAFPNLAGLGFGALHIYADEYAKEVGELVSPFLHPDRRCTFIAISD